MPGEDGEDQEDIVMTSTQANILNTKCPITGKHVTELEEPVRRYHILDCKHMFPLIIMQYIMCASWICALCA